MLFRSEFYYNKWGQDQLEKISLPKIEEIIADEKYWYPPVSDQDLYVAVGSTSKGEEYYNKKILEYEPFISNLLKEFEPIGGIN